MASEASLLQNAVFNLDHSEPDCTVHKPLLMKKLGAM